MISGEKSVGAANIPISSLGKEPQLTDLPNIGKETARLLGAVGIETVDQLFEIGSVGAAARIASFRPSDPPCRMMLAGLEGAIRGLRGHALPKDERETLWREYRSRVESEVGT